MTALVIAEHDHQTIKPSTLNTLTAAKQFNQEVDIFVAGEGLEKVAQQLSALGGVRRVLTAQAPHLAHQLAENMVATLVPLAKSYSHILAPSNAFGKNILPRLAVKLDVAQITDVLAIHSADTFDHPIYAGNAIATVQSLDPIKVMTIRTTAFEASIEQTGQASIESVEVSADLQLARFEKTEITKLERPELTSAQIVVSGGRGLGSGENYQKLLEPLADRLKAALGASRAAVDAGFVPNDYQVGQTGKVVAPQLYIAIGISGAIQHLAGMKDSKVIVAINKDPDAPIFSVADYGLVGDLFTLVPELQQALAN